ncbi:MAG: IS630 family transposase [Actinomycetia bacterium]|nr:IS630 family transposase [Actinomycetes bacterium]
MVAAAKALRVSDQQRAGLEGLARSETAPVREVRQAKVLLAAADGVANAEILRRHGVSLPTIRRWRSRFGEEGLGSIGRVRPGRGRPPVISDETVKAIVADTTDTVPDDGSVAWSTRTLADKYGVGKDTVARIWRSRGLRPWKVETFKLSNDPAFESKLVDVVGLYLNPPSAAAVFCFDEKTQVQALDRTQRSLPMVPGRCGTMTHDYKRNGTTDLFAAMNVATGEVLHDTRKRHTGRDVLAFFKWIDLHVDADLELHVILDNLSAHKSEPVQTWLDHPKRNRWHLHFTPTSSSWLNMIETWFSVLTRKALTNNSFTSVPELQDHLDRWISHWNNNPEPFIWTRTADEIIDKVTRGRATLNRITKSATHH